MRYSKVFLVLVVLFSFTFLKLDAASLTSEYYGEVDSSEVLCTVTAYQLTTAYQNESVILLDPNTNAILTATDNFDLSAPLVVPAGTTKLVLSEFELDENNKIKNETEVRTELNFADNCAIPEDFYVYNDETYTYDAPALPEAPAYVYNNPIATITYEDSKLTFDLADLGDSASAKYQFLDEGNSNEVVSGESIDVSSKDTVQYTEIDKDGNEKFYEIYLNNDKNTYMIKDVDSFDVKEIAISQINYKLVILTVIALILYIVVTVIHRINKKKYNEIRNKQRQIKKRRGQ